MPSMPGTRWRRRASARPCTAPTGARPRKRWPRWPRGGTRWRSWSAIGSASRRPRPRCWPPADGSAAGCSARSATTSTTGREDAELAERLLGDWMHAVLVRDGATVRAVQAWHAAQPARARWSCFRWIPGRSSPAAVQPLDDRLRASEPAAGWVRAALAGSEVLDDAGRVLRRASGAIFLSGAGAPCGPLRRRAEIATLVQDVERGRRRRGRRCSRARGHGGESGRARAGARRGDDGGRAGARGRAAGRGRPRGHAPAGRESHPGIGRLRLAARPAHRAPHPLRASG